MCMTSNERQRAVAALEKEFGPDWMTVAQELGTENRLPRTGGGREKHMAGQLLSQSGRVHHTICFGYETLLRKGHVGLHAARPDERQRNQRNCGGKPWYTLLPI